MALKTFGLSVVIGGVVASSFKNSFKSTNTSLSQMRNNIKGMNNTKLAIQKFKTLSKDASKNKKALDELGYSLKKVGIDTKNLDKDTRKFRLSLINLKKASRVQIKIDGIKDKFAAQKASIVGIGASLYGVTSIVSSANDVLKSQGEIRSLGISKQGIDAITKAGHEMSLQFGQITAPEFIKASYDIKSGIASLSDTAVAEFTKTASITAVATKSSTGEMTSLFATGFGIYRKQFDKFGMSTIKGWQKLSDEEKDIKFGEYFSAGIASSVQVFKTDGSQMSAAISNLGAEATSAGISFAEQLSVLGQLQKTMSGSESATKYRAFLGAAGKAQKELGLQFTDSNNKLLGMPDIIEKIKNKYGDVLDETEKLELKKAFGTDEAVGLIKLFYNETNTLKENMTSVQKELLNGTQKGKQMAADMDSGYGFEKMGNAMKYMSFTIGKAVVPAVDTLASALGGIAKGISWLDEKVPVLIPVLSGLAFGFLGIVTVLKSVALTKLAYTFATSSLKKAIYLESAANNMSALSFNRKSVAMAMGSAKAKTLAFWDGVVAVKTKAMTLWTTRSAIAQKGLAIASGIARSAMFGLNLVMSANPIGLVVVAIGALVGGLVWAYNKFDWFKGGIDSLWEGVKNIFSFSPLGLVMNGWGKVFDYLSGKFEWFGSAVDKFKSIGSTVGSWFGFGDDKQEEKKETPKAANNSKFEPAKAMKKVAASAVVATQLAAAPVTTPPSELNTYNNVVQKQELKKQERVISSNNTYSITVQVQSGNPQDIANEVQKAIAQMESSRKNRSFEDEEV